LPPAAAAAATSPEFEGARPDTEAVGAGRVACKWRHKKSEL